MTREFKEYDHVIIKSKNIPGQIVDVTTLPDGEKWYVVESDIEGYTDDPDAWGGQWPLYDCKENELEWVSSEEWND